MPVQQSQAFSSGIYRIAIKLRGNSREKIELIKGNSSSNHVQLRTIRDYGVCSRQVTVAEIVMPIGRYIAWVRVPTKPAMHSNLKPAGYSDRKPATLGVNRMGRFDDVVEG